MWLSCSTAAELAVMPTHKIVLHQIPEAGRTSATIVLARLLYITNELAGQIIGATPCVLFDKLSSSQAYGLNTALYPLRLVGVRTEVTAQPVRMAVINWPEEPAVGGIPCSQFKVVPDPHAKVNSCPCCGVPLAQTPTQGGPQPSAPNRQTPKPQPAPPSAAPAASGGGIVIEDVDTSDLSSSPAPARQRQAAPPPAAPQVPAAQVPAQEKVVPAVSQASHEAVALDLGGLEGFVAKAADGPMQLEDFERGLITESPGPTPAPQAPPADALERLQQGLPTLGGESGHQSPKRHGSSAGNCSVFTSGGKPSSRLISALCQVMGISKEEAAKLAGSRVISVAKNVSRQQAMQIKSALAKHRVNSRITEK
jgi:hypothetical protein